MPHIDIERRRECNRKGARRWREKLKSTVEGRIRLSEIDKKHNALYWRKIKADPSRYQMELERARIRSENYRLRNKKTFTRKTKQSEEERKELQKAACLRWREANKERVLENRLRSHAKESLKRSCSVPLELITDAMVSAKMEQLRVLRALKELPNG